MPKPGQYTRSRRMMMQAIMWVALGATVGVAALVRNVHSRPVELGPPVEWRSVDVRLPRGWAPEPQKPGRTFPWLGSPLMVLTAREPSDPDDEPGRVVTFYQDWTPGQPTPGQYLAAARNARANKYPPFKVGGRPGVKAVTKVRLETPEGVATGTSLWACTITETGLAITIKLDVAGGHGPDDERLLQRLADGVKFNDGSAAAAPPPTEGDPPAKKPE